MKEIRMNYFTKKKNEKCFDQTFKMMEFLIMVNRFSTFLLELKIYCQMHHLDANKTAGEEARRQLHKNVASNIEEVQAATPHKAPTIRSSASYHENYPS